MKYFCVEKIPYISSGYSPKSQAMREEFWEVSGLMEVDEKTTLSLLNLGRKLSSKNKYTGTVKHIPEVMEFL